MASGGVCGAGCPDSDGGCFGGVLIATGGARASKAARGVRGGNGGGTVGIGKTRVTTEDPEDPHAPEKEAPEAPGTIAGAVAFLCAGFPELAIRAAVAERTGGGQKRGRSRGDLSRGDRSPKTATERRVMCVYMYVSAYISIYVYL